MAEFRQFSTGANRDTDDGKLDYEGFLSPTVLHRFAEYMHKNRFLRDGSIRDSDNWQKGIPLDAYMKSGWRHFMDWWLHHRGALNFEGCERDFLEESLCALLFNVQGYLHEVLKTKGRKDEEVASPVSGPGSPGVLGHELRQGYGPPESGCRE